MSNQLTAKYDTAEKVEEALDLTETLEEVKARYDAEIA
jgi:hypothetical protein